MMKQVAVRLEEDFIKKVKLLALEENTTFQAIVVKALDRYLNPTVSGNEFKLCKLGNTLLRHQNEIKRLLEIDEKEIKLTRIVESGE